MLLRVYYPDERIEFKINLPESSVLMQPDDGCFPDQASIDSVGDLDSSLASEPQSTDSEDDTSLVSYESLMESKSWVYALGLGAGVGGALLPFLGLDLLLSSALGGATGLGVTHFWSSSSEQTEDAEKQNQIGMPNIDSGITEKVLGFIYGLIFLRPYLRSFSDKLNLSHT